MVLLCFATAGCSNDDANRADADSYRDEASQLFGNDNTASPDTNTGPAWAVVITRHTGPSAAEQAERAAQRIRTEGKLPDAYVVPQSGSALVVVGRFEAPTTSAAQAELLRVQNLELTGGARPYRFSFLGPTSRRVDVGSLPELNLLNAGAAYGSDALYTLQIGAYGPVDRAPTPDERGQAKRAAERAAADLRRDGELAFYYHGTHMSMVTVGVFGPGDFDPANPAFQSPALVALRDRYPENLVNGAPLLQKMGDKKIPQPSRLVRIPGAK